MATCQSPPLILISSYLAYFLGVNQPSPLFRIPELYTYCENMAAIWHLHEANPRNRYFISPASDLTVDRESWRQGRAILKYESRRTTQTSSQSDGKIKKPFLGDTISKAFISSLYLRTSSQVPGKFARCSYSPDHSKLLTPASTSVVTYDIPSSCTYLLIILTSATLILEEVPKQLVELIRPGIE